MARRLVAVLGPTGSGKSTLAIAIAERFHAEIVNADSRQIYRGMDIGTAKPSAADRARVPHHLFDIRGPGETYSLALYRRDVASMLEGIWSRDALPVLTGGTGQYAWAVLEDWQVPGAPPDEPLRAELVRFAEVHGTEALHQRLADIDPAAAAKIDHRNIRRVVRAIEVYETTGKAISEWQERRTPGFAWLALGLRVERAELDERTDQRVDAMFAAGLVDEVDALLRSGVPREAPAMGSIGYREVATYLAGECTLDEAIEGTKRATRRFARRQAQWFRPDDPRIRWVASVEEAMALVGAFVVAA